MFLISTIQERGFLEPFWTHSMLIISGHQFVAVLPPSPQHRSQERERTFFPWIWGRGPFRRAYRAAAGSVHFLPIRHLRQKRLDRWLWTWWDFPKPAVLSKPWRFKKIDNLKKKNWLTIIWCFASWKKTIFTWSCWFSCSIILVNALPSSYILAWASLFWDLYHNPHCYGCDAAKKKFRELLWNQIWDTVGEMLWRALFFRLQKKYSCCKFLM